MNRVLETKNAPAAIGPYSQGVAAGNVVFVSGQLPIVPETGELHTGSIGEQTAQSMRNIEAILAEAGCTMKEVVKTTIFLKDMGDFSEVNSSYGKFFNETPQVEIEAIAAKEGGMDEKQRRKGESNP